MLFLIAYYKQIIGVSLLALACYLGYEKIYSLGYKAAEAHYIQERIREQKVISDKIDNIETLSTKLINQTIRNAKALTNDMNNILKMIDGKPLVTIKNGECTPSETFVDTYNSLIDRGNQK